MGTKKRIIGTTVFWTVFTLLVLLGLFLLFGMVGYSFSALICFGIAGLMLCLKGLGILVRKGKRWAKVLAGALCAVVAVVFVAACITGWQIVMDCFDDPNPECPYVVVLGAGVHGTKPSLSLRARLDAAYVYLTEHPDAIAVVSGGQGPGEDISEAQCMFNDLLSKGIDPGRIWTENRSTSTRENIRFSLQLIEERTGSRPQVLNVLSSEFHLSRAKQVAKAEGVTAYGIGAKTPYVSLFVNYFLREIVAKWGYRILGG